MACSTLHKLRQQKLEVWIIFQESSILVEHWTVGSLSLLNAEQLSEYPEQWPARMESKVTYFCFKDPDVWAFALSTWDIARLVCVSDLLCYHGAWVILECAWWAHLCPTFVTSSHAAGYVLETNQVCQLQWYLLGSPWATSTACNFPVSTVGLTYILLSRDSHSSTQRCPLKKEKPLESGCHQRGITMCQPLQSQALSSMEPKLV